MSLVNVVRRFTGDDITGVSNGGAIGTWPESVGSQDGTQSSGGSKPTMVTAALNGHKGVDFNGSQFLETPSLPAITAATIFIVLKTRSTGSKYIIDFANGNHSIIQGFTTNKFEWYSSPRTVLGDIDTSQYQIIYTNVASTTSGLLRLGGYVGGGLGFDGIIVDIIVCDKAYSSGEITSALATLNALYFPSGDVIDPTGSIYSPTAAQILRGTHIFKVAAADDTAVASVQLKINGSLVGSPVTSPTSGYYEFSRDTTLLTNANNHTVSAVIIDTSGNHYETAAVTFEVDNLAPSGSITTPTAAQQIGGTFVFTGNAADLNSGVKNVKFFIDGVQENTDSSSPFTLSKVTTGLSNADHTVYAIVEDNAGNTYQTPTITFSVFNVVVPVAAFSVLSTAEIGEPVKLTDSSTGPPTTWLINWGDGTPNSTNINAVHRYRKTGIFTVTLTVTNVAGSHSTTHSITISDDLLPWENSEFLLRIDRLTNSNGAVVTAMTDLSGHARNAFCTGTGWTVRTNVVNSKNVLRTDGAQTGLKTAVEPITIRCGFIVVKFNEATFSDFDGLITAVNQPYVILNGKSGSNGFSDVRSSFPAIFNLFEYRLNDRIYPQSVQPAPMNVFGIIFFRFFGNITLDGIQIGADRDVSGRLPNMDLAAIALYSRDFVEDEIRKYSQKLATFYGLTLANVFPFLGEYDTPVDKDKVFLQSKAYDRTKVVRLKTPSKQNGTAVFLERDQTEHQQADAIWEANYPETPIVLRDYGLIPPIDINAYITSKITRTPKDSLISYSFDFEEV